MYIYIITYIYNYIYISWSARDSCFSWLGLYIPAVPIQSVDQGSHGMATGVIRQPRWMTTEASCRPCSWATHQLSEALPTKPLQSSISHLIKDICISVDNWILPWFQTLLYMWHKCHINTWTNIPVKLIRGKKRICIYIYYIIYIIVVNPILNLRTIWGWVLPPRKMVSLGMGKPLVNCLGPLVEKGRTISRIATA